MALATKERVIEKVFKVKEGVLLAAGAGLVAFGLLFLLKQSSSSEVQIIPAEQAKDERKTGELVVDIEGAVMRPGVYQLAAGSRINDLLIAAGGLSQEADRDWVAKNLNRAAPLQDGAKIYIPKVGERRGTVAGVSQEGVVNINQAGQVELESLPGIGPSAARRIIEYRRREGGFRSIEELMLVPGIGPKTFEKLKDRVVAF